MQREEKQMNSEKRNLRVCTANFAYCERIDYNMAICEECGIPYCSPECRDWDTEEHLKKCSAMLKKQSQAALASKRRNSF
jgi:hypothetical protein